MDRKGFYSLLLILIVGSAAASPLHHSTAINQTHKVKSISPETVSDLLGGKGMGFAKAAELNRYPGPRHVLDLSSQLQLSDQQIELTTQIFERMKREAIDLGTQLVEMETHLDALFSTESISSSELDVILMNIGKTEAMLRATHMKAHLEMKKVLSEHQINRYATLRGYHGAEASHPH